MATEERRRLYRHYARLMEALRVEDPQSFNYLRMEPAMFDELVQRVGPRIYWSGWTNPRCGLENFE